MIRQIATLMLLVGCLSPTAAARDFEKQIAAEPGGTLRVELSEGSVEVESHDAHEVHVAALVDGVGSRSLDFELTGNGVDAELTGDFAGWLSKWVGDPRVRVRVRVPHRYGLDIQTGGGKVEVDEIRGEIRARTSGGPIEIDEVEGRAELRTSGGSIKAQEIRGDLVARTSGGRISASEVTGSVDAHTSGGPIEIRDVRGRVDLHTSGGEISVRFSDAPEGVLETSGGDIEVEFHEDAGVSLDAKTSGGRVEVEHGILLRGDLEPGHVVGDINGGGRELRLRTSGGDILIRER
jgi:DUF4097 and DUF4098 domain-containing protein YvlB